MAKTSKITISKSGDPSSVGTKSNSSLTPTNTPTSDTPNEKILQQLQDINQNTMDSADAIAKTNTSITALTEAINNLKETTSKNTSNTLSAQKSSQEDPAFNERLQKLKNDNALMVQKAEAEKKKAADEANIRQVRLQQAQFNFARSQELAAQQNEDRARRLAENAEAQLKKEREEAGKYGPVAALGRGASAVYNAQSGTISKSITAALTGGIGNLIGLDRVVSAAGKGLGKMVSGIAGRPFQAMAKKREQNKADQRAIDNAVHAAELNKRIQDVLKSKGLVDSDKGDEKAKDSKKKKESSGATKGATAEKPMKGTEDRLDKIDNTLKGMSKKEKVAEKEEGGFFDKLLAVAGFIFNAVKGVISSGLGLVHSILGGIFGGAVGKGLASLASFAGKGLASLGSVIMHGITAAAPVIAPILAVAIGGVIGAYLAGKAVDWIDKNTNLTGGKSARASMKAAAGVGKKENKDAAQMAGGMAEFDLLNTQYEENKEELEAGRVWGKSSEKVAQWRLMRANAARNSLKLSGYENVVTAIDEAIKNKQISKEAGEDLLITRAKEVTERMKAANQGRDLEEVKAENLSRIENHKAKVAEAERKQNFNIKEKENSVVYGNVAKQEEQAAADKARYEKLADKYTHAAQVNREAGKVSAAAIRSNLAKEYGQKAKEIDELNGTMRTWSENDDMYAVEINKDLLTNSGQLSEEGILILKRQGMNDQQLQQVQNVMNNSINTSGSNIYQTNITQKSDPNVYASGDAARTMNM